jgi:hypothetical protein
MICDTKTVVEKANIQSNLYIKTLKITIALYIQVKIICTIHFGLLDEGLPGYNATGMTVNHSR